MIIKFFRGTGFSQVVLLVIIGVALWGGLFIKPPTAISSLNESIMPLWSVIYGAFVNAPAMAVMVSFLLLWLLIFLMIRFNTTVFFIQRRTYLPALIYVILYSFFPGQMIMNPALPAAILILIGIWRMISSYRHTGIAYSFFDASLLISAAGLLYADAIWYLILVIIGMLLFRSPDIKEIAVAFAGAVLPWAVFFAVWYLTGRDPGELSRIINDNLFNNAPSIYWSRTMVILLILLALILIPALTMLISDMPTQKVRSRKAFALLLWMMAVSGIIFIIVPSVSVELNALAAVPLAYTIGNYYTFTRRLATAEVMFTVMLILLVVSRIWPY